MWATLGLAVLAVPSDALDILYGPERFSRAEGEPQTIQGDIRQSGFEGPFYLNVRNGSQTGENRCSSAEIRLDGQVVVGPDSFSQQTPGSRVDVALSDRSLLEITLRSAPRCEVAVWIEGTAVPYWIEPILEEPLSTTKKIGPEGGSLVASLPDGTRLTLTLPEAALPYATDITITPLATSTWLPVGGPLVAGAAFSPPGLAFARLATIQIELPYPVSSAVSGFRYAEGGRGFHAVPFSGGGQSFSISIDHFSGVGVQLADPTSCDDLAGHVPSDPSGALEQQTACPPDPIYEPAMAWIASTFAYLHEMKEATVLLLNSAASISELATAIGVYGAWWADQERVSAFLMLLQSTIGDEYPRRVAELAAMEEEVDSAARAAVIRVGGSAETACAESTSCTAIAKLLKDLVYVQKLIDCYPPLQDLAVNSPALCGGLGQLSITTDAGQYRVGTRGQATATPHHVLNDATPVLTWSSDAPTVVSFPDTEIGTFNATGPGTAGIIAQGLYCGWDVFGDTSVLVTQSKPKAVVVEPPSLRLIVGQSASLSAVVKNDDDSVNDELTVVWHIGPGGSATLELEETGPREVQVRGNYSGQSAFGRATITASLEPPEVESTITSLPVNVVVKPRAVGAALDFQEPLPTFVQGVPVLRPGECAEAWASEEYDNGSGSSMPALSAFAQPDAAEPGLVSLEVAGQVRICGINEGVVWLTVTIGPPSAQAQFVSAPLKLIVLPPPVVSVDVTPAVDQRMTVGEEVVLTAVPKLADGTTRASIPVSWRMDYNISKPAPVGIQTDDHRVLLRGIAPGTVLMTAIVEPPYADGAVISEPVRVTVASPGQIAYHNWKGYWIPPLQAVFITSADGSGGAMRLTPEGWDDSGLSWSPDGSRMALFRAQNQDRMDLWVMNADGSDAKNLTADLPSDPDFAYGPYSLHYAPVGPQSWSVNNRIVFLRHVLEQCGGSSGWAAKWWTMNADGSDKKPLTPYCADYSVEPVAAAWSPDGTKLAFSMAYDCGQTSACFGIGVVNEDGSGWHAVAAVGWNWNAEACELVRAGSYVGPVWTPDGRITYLEDRSRHERLDQDLCGRQTGWQYSIKVVGPDGTNSGTILSRDSLGAFGSFDWSPSGEELVVTDYREYDGNLVYGGLAVYGSDGSFKRWVVPFHAEPDGAYLEDSPAWRPEPR